MAQPRLRRSRPILATALLLWSGVARAATLEDIRARGSLACGVVSETPDWNKEDMHGDLSALGREICRAMAIATLGRLDAADVHVFPAEADALRGLAAGQADVVVGVTPSATRTQQYGVTFGPPVFWDTQTFMMRRAPGIVEASGLAGQTVCFIDGTDDGRVLLSAMKARGIAIRPFPFQEEGEMEAGLAGGHCRAVSAYASRLAGMRTRVGAMAHDFVLLPDVLAVSPASVATRHGDAVWSEIVAATVDTLVGAEMAGIARDGVDVHRRADDPVVQHLLGIDWSAGLSLGLARDWSARVIAGLGNYGEVFNRTVGEGSAFGLKRGLNAICLHGGVLCAAPVR